jgi:formylglycine-generating enzyme required for sulfatase activity
MFMTRRGILVGGIGTVLGISGCQAVTKSVVVASSKAALDSTTSFEKERLDAEAKVKKNGLRLEPLDERPKDSLFNFPALQAYLKGLKDIPAGSFRYGFFHGQSEAAQRVDVSAFRMGATPVTWAVWKEYCDAEAVRLPDEPDWGRLGPHPVVNVSYDDIVGSNGGGGFCGWVSRIAGFTVALPTSEQFEFAARGGEDGFDYPWGNEFDTSKLWCEAKQTAGVDRTYRNYRNGYGLTDMAGNVYQWCSNDYKDGKEIRGGSWPYNYLVNYRFQCARRDWMAPAFRLNDGGFRLSAPA